MIIWSNQNAITVLLPSLNRADLNEYKKERDKERKEKARKNREREKERTNERKNKNRPEIPLNQLSVL